MQALFCGRAELHRGLRFFRADNGIAALAPAIETAGERADIQDASVPEFERRTGAGGLAGSSTVENQFAVARESFYLLIE